VIAGRVWEDECGFPDGSIDPYKLPEGWAVVEGGVLADGVLDEEERGIPGIEVRIAKGECPFPGTGVLASSGPTDENGYYYYFAPVGTYCVTVIPGDPGSDELLLPGTFSHPINENLPLGTAYLEVTVEYDGQAFSFCHSLGTTHWLYNGQAKFCPTLASLAAGLEKGCYARHPGLWIMQDFHNTVINSIRYHHLGSTLVIESRD